MHRHRILSLRAHKNNNSTSVFSVAPSFFHTCVAAGSKGVARMEDVERFKVSVESEEQQPLDMGHKSLDP